MSGRSGDRDDDGSDDARAHLDGGFDTSERWDEIAPGVRMAAGLAGEPSCGPVLVFLDAAVGTEVVPVRSIGSETIVAPVSGSIDVDGATMTQGDVRVEEAEVDHPALVAGPDGVQLVVTFADRRALRSALADGTMAGALGTALSTVIDRAPEPVAPHRLHVLITSASRAMP